MLVIAETYRVGLSSLSWFLVDPLVSTQFWRLAGLQMHQMKHATGQGLLFISYRLANAPRLVAPVRPIREAQAKVAGTEIVCDRRKLSCKAAQIDPEPT